MSENEEQIWANQLRQSQVVAARNPASEDPPQEGAPGAPETLETPGQEQAAKASLFAARHLKILQQKMAARAVKLAGRAGQVGSMIIQRVGTTLLSFGLGTGLTIIGLLIGIPLIIIGVICVGIGLLAAIGARATVTAGEMLEKKAKNEEKQLEKEGRGAVGKAKEAVEAVKAFSKYAAIIATPLLYIGCTLIGMLSGFILLGMLVGGVLGAL